MSTVGESRLAIQTTTDGFYSPLLGQRDIRLLEVLPGDDGSIVVTAMITVSLDSKPNYAALSYVWGDATQTSIIECNGKSISITTSLAAALKAFRSFSAGPDAPLNRFQKIWADQLCINQHDVLERNYQVSIMGSIYSSSAFAFVWLGPGDEHFDQALRFTDALADLFSEHAIRLDEASENDITHIYPLLHDASLPPASQTWAGLVALFSRPWFNRSWTFQEPILAPDRMLACGSKVRSWETFLHTAVLFIAYQYPQMTAYNVPRSFSLPEYMHTKPKDLCLSHMIFTTRKRQGSDPRDKVYALYGLVQGDQKVPLEINYAMSVEDVYKSAVRYCIENEGVLSVLSYVSLFKNQSDLPSWVPDWRDQSRWGFHPVTQSPGSSLFKASSATRALLVPSSSNDKLILKGFTLSIVERTIQVAALRVNPADSSRDSWRTNAEAAGVPMHFLQGKTLQTPYDLTTTMECSPFHNSLSQAYARTMWPKSTAWFVAGRPDPIPQAVLTEYTTLFDTQTHKSSLFLTKDSLGLAPAPTMVGDRVCILLGGNAPFILRPRQNLARTTPSKEAESVRPNISNTTPQRMADPAQHGSQESVQAAKQALEATEWILIGDCYLYGYMRGEAMEMVPEEDYVNFTLV